MPSIHTIQNRAGTASVDQLRPQLVNSTDRQPGPGERARISRACRGSYIPENHLQGESGAAASQRVAAGRRQLPPGDRPSILSRVAAAMLSYAAPRYWCGLIATLAFTAAVSL